MIMNNFATIMFWYIFMLYMIHLASVKVKTVLETKQMKKIRAKKIKTQKEQLLYIKENEGNYIPLPLFLVIITIYVIIIIDFTKYFITTSDFSDLTKATLFMFGVFFMAAASFLYSYLIMYRLFPTNNKENYLITTLLYCLLLSISMLINTFYPTGLHWIITMVIVILNYIFCKKILKWRI